MKRLTVTICSLSLLAFGCAPTESGGTGGSEPPEAARAAPDRRAAPGRRGMRGPPDQAARPAATRARPGPAARPAATRAPPVRAARPAATRAPQVRAARPAAARAPAVRRARRARPDGAVPPAARRDWRRGRHGGTTGTAGTTGAAGRGGTTGTAGTTGRRQRHRRERVVDVQDADVADGLGVRDHLGHDERHDLRRWHEHRPGEPGRLLSERPEQHQRDLRGRRRRLGEERDLRDQIGDGIHCLGSCTIENVWFPYICDDAITMLGGSGKTATIKNSGFKGARDKMIQHNGDGSTVTIDTSTSRPPASCTGRAARARAAGRRRRSAQ